MFYRRMMQIDVRIIYIVLALTIMFPMLRPIGFPVPVDPTSEKLYNVIAELPPGTPIIYSFDTEPAGTTENKPAARVLIDLSLKKGHRVILMGLFTQGPDLGRMWCNDLFEANNAVYGVDYIDLGYIAAANSWYNLARTDIIDSWNNRDYEGRTLTDFPIMEGISKASDITAVCTIGTGAPGYIEWTGQWYATGEVGIILAAVTGINTPGALAYYNLGLLRGLAGGLAGGLANAATLEPCHDVTGSAHGNSDAQSFGHLAVIAFLILGNIGYFGAKRAGEVS